MAKPVVALVGRQNVGKSTLLNRLAGKRIAIVEDLPGTTRDRIFADVDWDGTEFTLVDTAGLILKPATELDQNIREQVEIAIAEADLIVFLGDVRTGVTAADLEIAEMLRRTNKKVILAVNKVDDPKHEPGLIDFYQLGMGDPVPISAYHGLGIDELVEKIKAELPPAIPEEKYPNLPRIAIVGRPNVGKSTLLNSLAGDKRATVSETPGTTRDAIDTLVDFKGQNVIIIDTAGLRRRGQWGTGIERYSVLRAFGAIERADVVLLVLDAAELLAAQDMHVAGYIQQAAKGVVLVVNKWDLAEVENETQYTQYIRSRLKFMTYAPIAFVSAKTGKGVNQLLPQALRIYQERQRRLPDAEIDAVIQEAVAAQSPPRKGTRQLKIFKTSQTGINPPTFVFSVNDPKLMHFSYQRFLENRLRQSFGFVGTPIRLIFK